LLKLRNFPYTNTLQVIAEITQTETIRIYKTTDFRQTLC
jgi:hypothetical protein